MEEKYHASTQLLKEPVSFADLINAGAQFEVDMNHNNVHADDFCALDDQDDSDQEPDVSNEELVSPWTQSFPELKSLMLRVSEFLYKRITRVGHKERGLVPDKARVAVRYSGYWEGETAPFDSSLLRGTKFEFETGQQMVLEGLEAAVRTMCPYEQAEFIISYQLLFREMGCPPRIRPRADGLFKIEVIDFTLIGDAEALQQLQREDRDKFEVVFPKAKDMHLHGKDCVKRGKYHNAVTAFEKAISSLNYCRLADEQQELKQTELLITLYQNLMICYNKIQRPQRACIMMKAIRRLSNNQPSCKALFQEGRALSSLGEYERARRVFLQAQLKQPSNKEISDEILNMEQRVSKYKQASRDLWTRALNGKQTEPKELEEPNSTNLAKDKKFKEDCDALIEQFAQTSVQSIGLSRKTYSDKEFKVLCQLAKERNMKLSLSPIHEDLLTLAKMKIN